jgi:hypothetical protein
MYFDQQGWSVLEDVTMLGLDEVKDFAITKEDGTFETKTLMHHLCIFKGLLLLYN